MASASVVEPPAPEREDDVLVKILPPQRVAYFTAGHEESSDRTTSDARGEGSGAEILKELLQKQGFDCKSLKLSETPVAGLDSAALVLVIGPRAPFETAELDQLRRYVRGGGKLLLAIDPIALLTARARKNQPARPPGFERKLAKSLEALAQIAELELSASALANDAQFARRTFDDSDHGILITNLFSPHLIPGTRRWHTSTPVSA